MDVLKNPTLLNQHTAHTQNPMALTSLIMMESTDYTGDRGQQGPPSPSPSLSHRQNGGTMWDLLLCMSINFTKADGRAKQRVTESKHAVHNT